MWLVFATRAEGQSEPRASNTTQPVTNGRYEIVESSAGPRNTFLLDRYDGDIWQLVVTPNEQVAWQKMEVIGKVVENDTTPRFQIFLTQHGVRNSFLIDTMTGDTWVLVRGERTDSSGKKAEYLLWQPFS